MVEKREAVAGGGPDSGSMVAVIGIAGGNGCSSRRSPWWKRLFTTRSCSTGRIRRRSKAQRRSMKLERREGQSRRGKLRLKRECRGREEMIVNGTK
jgi:hypothetical protein